MSKKQNKSSEEVLAELLRSQLAKSPELRDKQDASQDP